MVYFCSKSLFSTPHTAAVSGTSIRTSTTSPSPTLMWIIFLKVGREWWPHVAYLYPMGVMTSCCLFVSYWGVVTSCCLYLYPIGGDDLMLLICILLGVVTSCCLLVSYWGWWFGEDFVPLRFLSTVALLFRVMFTSQKSTTLLRSTAHGQRCVGNL